MILNKIDDTSMKTWPIILGIHQEGTSHELVLINNSHTFVFVMGCWWPTVIKREGQ